MLLLLLLYMGYCETINCFTSTGIGPLDYWYDTVLKYSVRVSQTQKPWEWNYNYGAKS